MGVFTRRQLVAGGIHDSTVSRRAGRGVLHRVLPGVYSSEVPTYTTRCEALRLWKPDAVFSHDTAAWMWDLLPGEPGLVHATIPRTGTAGGPGWVRLHRRTLTNVRWLGDMPIVSIEHAILDVASTLTRPQFEKVIDSALSRSVSWRALAQLCDEAAGKTGMTVLRDQLRRACPHTLSEPERMVARALTARNFHMEINGKVGPYYGDLVDRRARVIVEVDGREFHVGSSVFTSDRRRQNELVLDEWMVLRYSAATVSAHVDAVADEIVGTVRRRRSRARRRT